MNFITDSLIKLGLLKKDLDYHLIWISLILIFLFFGYQKWFEYDAAITGGSSGTNYVDHERGVDFMLIAESDYYKQIIRFPRLATPCDTRDINGMKPCN